MITLIRKERNALWFGLGAVVTLAGIATIAFLPDPNCSVAYIKLQGSLVTYPIEYGAASGKSTAPAKASHTAASENDPMLTGVTTSEDVAQSIRTADEDSKIQAIVLEIDSPGGSPVAGEEVADALKAAGKPTIALIRDEGDSAAYMAATGAKKIYASQFSNVGDIGITSSYTDQSGQDVDNGITFNELSIGKYKDLGNPDKPLTDDEYSLEIAQLQEYYKDFVALVARNRHLSVETVTTLANGAGIPANDAKADGLIDSIGGYQQVKNYLAEVLHAEPKFCNY